MKALVHEAKPGLEGLHYTDMPEQSPGPDEVKVRLYTAGLNRRDLRVTTRRDKKVKTKNDNRVTTGQAQEYSALIVGSDGAGIIETVGENVRGVSKGDEVILNPGLGWITKSDAPPFNFNLIGSPDHGTLAETIIVPADNVEPKPEHLTWEEAGVLPLAALTAYRALFSRAKLQPGQTVFIPGIGSGVATYLLQMAKKYGARVIVTSRSEEKRKKALSLGADRAIDTASDWKEELANETIDIVIESVGDETFNRSLKALRLGGTIVVFGATTGAETSLNLRQLFHGQYNVLGSTMGSRDEFRDMLDFINLHAIRPIVSKVFPLSQGKEAFEYLAEGNQFGNVSLKIKDM